LKGLNLGGFQMVKLIDQAKVYLETFNAAPPIIDFEPAVLRAASAQQPISGQEKSTIENVEERLIPTSDGEEIKIRIYTPVGKGPFPVFVYYHGGGWVLGSLDSFESTCRLLAQRTNSIVVSVDYRLAPEYKFPTPYNDCYEALTWIQQNSSTIDKAGNTFYVGGDSAGGNLAAAVSLKAREDENVHVDAQILIYPVTALDYNTKSYQLFGKGFGLDKELMEWFGQHYTRTDEDRKNIDIAVLHAPDVSNLPPAFVLVCEADVLRDEGLLYAEKLKSSGNEVEVVVKEGLVHGYFGNVALFYDTIEQTISDIHQFIKEKAGTVYEGKQTL